MNGKNRKLKKVEQTVSFHAETETRNRKSAKREEILGGVLGQDLARAWPGSGQRARFCLGSGTGFSGTSGNMYPEIFLTPPQKYSDGSREIWRGGPDPVCSPEGVLGGVQKKPEI